MQNCSYIFSSVEFLSNMFVVCHMLYAISLLDSKVSLDRFLLKFPYCGTAILHADICYFKNFSQVKHTISHLKVDNPRISELAQLCPKSIFFSFLFFYQINDLLNSTKILACPVIYLKMVSYGQIASVCLFFCQESHWDLVEINVTNNFETLFSILFSNGFCCLTTQKPIKLIKLFAIFGMPFSL